MYNYKERLAKLKKLGLLKLTVYRVMGEALGQIPLSPNSIGHLILLHKFFEAKFKIEIAVNDNPFIFETVGAKSKVMPLEDKNFGVEKIRRFVKTVRTHPDKNGAFTTKNNPAQNNGLWFVHITPKGKLQMWEIAIVTNVKDGYSNYYLSLQEVYSAKMYQTIDGGLNSDIYIPEQEFPGFSKWESLKNFFENNISAINFPLAESYRPKVKVMEDLGLDNPKLHKAKVIFFSQSRRYGLCWIDYRLDPAIIHASEIKAEFPALEPGQIVSYESLRKTIRLAPNGLSTKEGFELVGVNEI